MKLSDLYQTLTAKQRERLAKKAGTDPQYLWQVATQWRGKKASLDLIIRLSKADRRLKLLHLVREFGEPAAEKDHG